MEKEKYNGVLDFVVHGEPAPGGSKRAFPHRSTGKMVVVDDAKGNKRWRQQVAAEAVKTLEGKQWTVSAYKSILKVAFTFYLKRPQAHYRGDRLRLDAPVYHTKRPDTTKLIRSTEDALTGILWNDDAQIVIQSAMKRYCNEGMEPCCFVSVAVVDAAGKNLH